MAIRKASAKAIESYETLDSGLRRVLNLARVSAEAGHHRRAAAHVLGALRDLAPELARLREEIRS